MPHSMAIAPRYQRSLGVYEASHIAIIYLRKESFSCIWISYVVVTAITMMQQLPLCKGRDTIMLKVQRSGNFYNVIVTFATNSSCMRVAFQKWLCPRPPNHTPPHPHLTVSLPPCLWIIINSHYLLHTTPTE